MAKKKSGVRLGGFLIRPLGIIVIILLVLAIIAAGTLVIIRVFGSSDPVDKQEPKQVITLPPTTMDANATPFVQATPTNTPEPTPEPTPMLRSAVIRSLGEIVIQDNLIVSARNAAQAGETSYDFEPMLEDIKNVVGNADWTVADIEGPMDTRAESAYSGDSSGMNTPAQLILALKASGVDMLTLANDHSLDMLFDGLLTTIENCTKAGVDYVGAAASQAEHDQPKIIDINGIKVGFLNYTTDLNGKEKSAKSDALVYGVNLVSKTNCVEDVKKLKDAGADVVVAYVSWGELGKRTLGSEEKKMSQLMANAGVNVVIGFNPLTTIPAYVFEGKLADGTDNKMLCLCATGGFLSDVRKQYMDSGVIFEFTIQETASGTFEVTNPIYIPTYVWRKGEEASAYEYRVLAAGEWLEERPDGMEDADYERLKAVWTEIQETMGQGNADAKVSAN